MLFQCRSVRISRQSAGILVTRQIFVTLQEWNEQASPDKVLIFQEVMAANGLR